MDIIKSYETVMEKIKQGQSIEEIYVEYDGLIKMELEKGTQKTDIKKVDEYKELRDEAATQIVSGALREAGYRFVSRFENSNLKHGRWKKNSEI